MLDSRVFILSLILVVLLPASAFAQSLQFDPDPFIPASDSFAVPMIIETGGLSIKGIETIVTFDPALVSLDSITAGPWFTDSGQDYFFWDYTIPFTYAIHFASAMLDGTNSADGIIAYCHFSFLDYGSCPLDFTLVDVRDGNNADLGFGNDSGLILLDPAVETKNVQFSSLKAIYR